MLVIESYRKFISNRKKVYKKWILNIHHYGLIKIWQENQDEQKTKDIISRVLKYREIKRGYVVWKTTFDVWGFPITEIFFSKRIIK